MRRSRGYSPLETSPGQDAILDRIVETARGAAPGSLSVFDLDGCLFDTRWRQVAILAELGSRNDWPPLFLARPEHFIDWDLRSSLIRAGMPMAWVETHYDSVRSFWLERFFADDAVGLDHALPGAAALVHAVAAEGVGVVYLSGRHEGNRGATVRALRRFGFPVEGCRVVLQPSHQTDYTTYKGHALDTIADWGAPVLLLDNEPANANLFRERFPDSLVVFIETDHSDAPIEPHAEIPWIRGFIRHQTTKRSRPLLPRSG